VDGRDVGHWGDRSAHARAKHLRRRGLLPALDSSAEDEGADAGGLSSLAASAVSGQSAPAGPEWRRKSAPLPSLVPGSLGYDKPLCASLDGFTLHAATRAGAMDTHGREALCKYVLRPVVAQERITHGPDGLVRITLNRSTGASDVSRSPKCQPSGWHGEKKPFADGTVAVDMDPLSLLCRLAASVPPPRLHTVRYCGVLAPASKLRSRVVPKPAPAPVNDAETETETPKRGGSRYRPWAELLQRCFDHPTDCMPRSGGDGDPHHARVSSSARAGARSRRTSSPVG
jgi:hypothetical protein